MPIQVLSRGDYPPTHNVTLTSGDLSTVCGLAGKRARQTDLSAGSAAARLRDNLNNAEQQEKWWCHEESREFTPETMIAVPLAADELATLQELSRQSDPDLLSRLRVEPFGPNPNESPLSLGRE